MKSISVECSECGKFKVTSALGEAVEYCPFCGDRVPMPAEDDEDDDDGMREFDPDEEDE